MAQSQLEHAQIEHAGIEDTQAEADASVVAPDKLIKLAGS
jgi:hypothetical protein